MKEIALKVNGREMTFSEQELAAIVEKHFSNKTTKKATTTKVPSKPVANRWFEVKPMEINKELFEKKREDIRQESIRQLILEAFTEMEKNPFKYSKNFRTKIITKYIGDTVPETHAEINSKYEYCCADWVRQALEWAQRIANGQSWESLCNDADTSKWYRVIIWKTGGPMLVGGSIYDHQGYSATYIGCGFLERRLKNAWNFAAPLVYEEI